MKRLYVTAERTRQRTGARPGHPLLARPRRRATAEIHLDTLPMMGAAQGMYESLGFRDIAPYYDTPIAGTRFMARTIGPGA